VTVDSVVYTAGEGDLVDNLDGTWTLTIPTTLTENPYDVTVTVTDGAGNSTSDSSTNELEVDTTAPTTPTVAPNLVASDDTGASSIDDIASTVSPTFDVPAGTATEGESVELFADGVSIGTGTVLADGSFSIATTGLVEGPNAITYTLTDVAGNTSVASPALTYTLDTSVVAVVITTPIEGDDVVNAAEETDVLIEGIKAR